MKVVLADYGAGNLRSVQCAFERAGGSPAVSADPAEVLEAPLAVVAGVGHAASAARGLRERGLDEALRERARAGRPTLGICVGLQLLFEESEEGGSGLGILRGPVVRVRARRVPHMGWNELRAAGRPVSSRVSTVRTSTSRTPTRSCRTTTPSSPLTRSTAAASWRRSRTAGWRASSSTPSGAGRAGAALLANVLRWSRSA